MEKSNISTKFFPTSPYLDNADVERNKSVSYNSQIHPSGSLESSAYRNCKDADEHMRLSIIALRGWGYYHLIGDLESASDALKVNDIQGEKFGKSLEACGSDLDRLGI